MFAKDLLKNKVVLVTGGRGGVGYNIAASCLGYGATVYITSRRKEKIKKAAMELSKLGPCYAIPSDVRVVEQVREVATYIEKKSGRLDILVNNAGGQFPTAAEDISTHGWDTVVNNNLNGTWYMTQEIATRFFIPQEGGNIINIIANIYRGFPGMVHTGAARAGVDNMTKTLAVEWSRFNLRINAIALGIIESTDLEQYPAELLEGVSRKIPLKRLGKPQEVADLAIFLMSSMATFITGETICIDGGQRLWGDIFEC